LQRAIVAAPADLHVGSPFALCPPTWTLPDGATPLHPNELQTLIRSHWLDCWDRVGSLRKGARLIVVLAGDACEGLHHESVQVTTARLEVQEAMAVSVMEEGLHRAKFSLRKHDTLRCVTGTGAHDGGGGASFERVARQLTDYSGDGRVSREADDFTVNGVRILVSHKPGSGPGSRNQTLGNAYQSWLKSLYFGALEAGGCAPRYVLTAHHHRFMPRDVYRSDGTVALTGVMLPAWKVKDEYIWQVNPFGLAQVGMVALEVMGDGATVLHDWRIPIEQGKSEAL
jgi:hypothetical protein